MFRTLFGKHFLKILFVAILLFIGYIIFSADKVEAATTQTFNDTNGYYFNGAEALYNSVTSLPEWSTYSNCIVIRTWTVRVIFTNNPINCTISNKFYVTSNTNNCVGYFLDDTTYSSWRRETYNLNSSFYEDISSQWKTYPIVGLFKGTSVTFDPDTYFDSSKVYPVGSSPFRTPPFIDTSTQDIQNWSFTTFDINMGTYERNTTYKYVLDYSYNGVSRYMDVTNYFFDDYNIKIPVEDFAPGIVLRNGSTLSFGLLAIYSVDGVENTLNYFTIDDNSYTLSLTTEQEEQLYQDRSTQTSTNIFVNTENINNSLTSSDYDKSDIDNILSFDTGLSGLDVVSALQNMFHTVELAFVSNEPIDIVFTIPFTDAEFVIPYNYTEQHIPLSGRLMLQVIWLGLVSLWCFKRVMTIVDFVEEGDFDMVFKNGDVKKEVL